MAEAPSIEVSVLYMTEERLRNVIREELNAFAERLEHTPLGFAPRISPMPEPIPWWQQITCGTSAARPSERQVVINATGPGKEPPADMLKERGY